MAASTAAPIDTPRPPARALAAAGWMLVSLLSFVLVAVAGRGAAPGIDTFQLMFWRSAIGLAILLVIAVPTGGLGRLATPQFGLHIGRNIVHYGAQFSWLYALTLLPLAQLFALEFMSPLWVALLAPALLGERLTGRRIAAALIGFSGTALVIFGPALAALAAGTGAAPLALLASRPSLGVILGASCALGFALSMLAAKRLTRTDSAFTILFWMMALQTIGGVVPMLGGVTIPSPTTAFWIVVLALAALSAHFGLTKAIGLADAIIVAPLDFLRLPLIALVGALVYEERLDPWVLAGGGLVVMANIFNIWSEGRARATAKDMPAGPARL